MSIPFKVNAYFGRAVLILLSKYKIHNTSNLHYNTVYENLFTENNNGDNKIKSEVNSIIQYDCYQI